MSSNAIAKNSVGVVAMLLASLPGWVAAAPAAPGLHRLAQPHGETFMARQWGDEKMHGWETETGRSIVKDPVTGVWGYAVLGADGKLTSSGVPVAGKNAREAVESSFEPRVRPVIAAPISGRAPRYKNTAEAMLPVVPPTGTANVAVILENFSNTTTTNTPAQFRTLLFGAVNKSMSKYYKEVSYGKFTVAPGPSGVKGWYKAPNVHDYYGANDVWGYDAWPGDLVYEAVRKADAAGFNFAAYDKDGDCHVDVVAVVHQGEGEEASGQATDIWSHRWDLSSAQYWGNSHYGAYTTRSACPKGGKMIVNDYIIQPERLWNGKQNIMQTMGVFAHEYGHSLGLPDLYDIDYSSAGVGDWSLMAYGTWNYVTNWGDRPAHMDAWSKYMLGWVTPTLVTGTLTSEPITAASGTIADVYQIRDGSPETGGEYFLVENRQKTGFDAGLPGSGLLIWHIDEAKATDDNTDNSHECYPGGPSCTTQHYRVALVQADNLWNLEKHDNRGDAGDPYPGTSGKRAFTAASNPKSVLYSGAASKASVTAISRSRATMTATLKKLP